jgi:hypothetical protein
LGANPTQFPKEFDTIGNKGVLNGRKENDFLFSLPFSDQSSVDREYLS